MLLVAFAGSAYACGVIPGAFMGDHGWMIAAANDSNGDRLVRLVWDGDWSTYWVPTGKFVPLVFAGGEPPIAITVELLQDNCDVAARLTSPVNYGFVVSISVDDDLAVEDLNDGRTLDSMEIPRTYECPL